VIEWTKPDVHEALATLYLRLNGYFTTGLVVHSSEWGKNRTETDCLAIRNRHHAQPDREVPTAEFLQASDGEMDLIVCEAKSRIEDLGFNEALKDDAETVRSVLRWAGCLDETQVQSVADRLMPLFGSDVTAAEARAGVLEGQVRIRPLLCCPPASADECGDRWCLVGAEIIRFASECFNPATRRATCSTRYNFKLWGYALSPIVEYFKNAGGDAPTLNGLYEHLNAV
jgi:hypothetical protein